MAAAGVVARRAWGMGGQPPGIASLPVPPSHEIGFQVMRHGTSIGTHTLSFEVNGDQLQVDIAVNVVLHLGPIPIVRYTHRAMETWRDGLLVALAGQTNRNGTELHMSAHRTPAGLLVEGSGTDPYIAPPDALPTTYWNERMLYAPMIGTQDGGLVHPKVTPKGGDAVRLASGRDEPAECFALTGDLSLDLWYTAEGHWVSMRFEAADGSTIKYERL